MPQVGYKHLVGAAMPGTLGEITGASGVRLQTVVRWLRIMRKNGECHVSGWKRSDGSGPIKRIYTFGPGKDVPRTLKPRTPRAYEAKWRKGHRLELELYNARRRARTAADRAAVAPSTWLSALMGARP